MNYRQTILFLFMTLISAPTYTKTIDIRIATFNVSMEATNYAAPNQVVTGAELHHELTTGNSTQIKNIAEIIQRTKPDIILLNEFDYQDETERDVELFRKNYLEDLNAEFKTLEYPYFYAAPVNTGLSSGMDLDGDGVASRTKGDAFGFGLFPGQYGMLVLSRYPIKHDQIRTFQHFLWKDMPGNLLTSIKKSNGQAYYSTDAQNILRLSSKSHWDVPILIGQHTVHLLASHPTPPVFDGPENRNGKRNHDEIRFWTDYISGGKQASYIYDDKGKKGGVSGKYFVIAGDLNASADEGDGLKKGIQGLLNHPKVNDSIEPESEGGKLNSPNNLFSAGHTAEWAMRADYVLPSDSFKVINSGVFWPISTDPLHRLVKDRKSSSDHRLVWVDLELK